MYIISSLRSVFDSATALFTCPYPNQNAPSTIQVFDFGHPVLDFVVVEDGCVWALLDGVCTENNSGRSMARIVKFVEGRVRMRLIDFMW
jgi:hypothetical protein